MKPWFSGIFGFFFSRAVTAIVGFAVILLLILIPFFKQQLLSMVENQGQTFSNSTIAAITDDLYTGSYGEIIDYLGKVLKDTGNILFVVITDSKGQEIVIENSGWKQSNSQFGFNKVRLGKEKRTLLFADSNPITKKESFIYHQEITIGGASWGVLTVGMSDREYLEVKNQYSLIVWSVAGGLVFVLLLLFYKGSKRIRIEISSLSEAGLALQMGNLSARAAENGTGEIGTLSKAINVMATNLQAQTNSTRQLAQIVEQTNDAFILFDAEMNIVFVNDAILDVTGYQLSSFQGKSLVDFSVMLNLSLDKMLQELNWISTNKHTPTTRDVVITKNDQSSIDVEIRIEDIEIEGAQEQHFLVVLSNIATRKGLENKLHQLAFYDKLTDLPNRRMFIDDLRSTTHQCKKDNKKFALFFMDLDDFKFVNDTLGHEAGDEFLVEIGNRLRQIFRADDVVARLGGDEFTVIIKSVTDIAVVDLLAKKLVAELSSNPIHIHERELTVSTSLGVAIYPDDGADSDTLLRSADTAMYAAKKQGKNRHAFFSEEMNANFQHRLEMERDLGKAIALGNQITYYYQPIFDLNTDKLVGAEALARWDHPEKGFISPEEFIPVAEGSNLIVLLSDYLLHVAFQQAQKWHDYKMDLYLSINISVRQFNDPNFVSKLQVLLKTYQLEASELLLEFTESVMLDSDDETIAKFDTLKKIGFKVAIDDFGTGYSSLGYIHQFPIDVIKVDQSFVIGMLENKKSNAIVAAISKMSNALEMKTIAEGVESAEHAERLKEYGCDYVQGLYYDAALPTEEFDSKYVREAKVVSV